MNVFQAIPGTTNKQILSDHARNLCEKVAYKIVEALNVSLGELRSKNRRADYVEARKIFCYLASTYGCGPYQIAEFIWLDQSTVRHHIKTCEEQMGLYKAFREKVEKVKS